MTYVVVIPLDTKLLPMFVPGDLLYIPQYWFHHVRSSGSPNIAINIWFGQFNFDDNFAQAGLSEDTNVVEVRINFANLYIDYKLLLLRQ